MLVLSRAGVRPMEIDGNFSACPADGPMAIGGNFSARPEGGGGSKQARGTGGSSMHGTRTLSLEGTDLTAAVHVLMYWCLAPLMVL